jgi:hypothetical protein
MRWFIFFSFAFVLYVLQFGLRSLWQLPIGPFEDASPDLLLILGVYVAIRAPRHTVFWAMLVLGMLTDLQPVRVDTQSQVLIIGPGALGFMLGGFVALQLRAVMFRERLTAVMALTFVVGVFVHLAIVALLTMRGLPVLPSDAIEAWSPANQILQRLVSLIYTVVFAIPLGWVLMRSKQFWRFESGAGTASGTRSN